MSTHASHSHGFVVFGRALVSCGYKLTMHVRTGRAEHRVPSSPAVDSRGDVNVRITAL